MVRDPVAPFSFIPDVVGPGNGDRSRMARGQTPYGFHTGSKRGRTQRPVRPCEHTMAASRSDLLVEYKFTKYNVQSNVYVYSQEEYQRLLTGQFHSRPRCAVISTIVYRQRLDEGGDRLPIRSYKRVRLQMVHCRGQIRFPRRPTEDNGG